MSSLVNLVEILNDFIIAFIRFSPMDASSIASRDAEHTRRLHQKRNNYGKFAQTLRRGAAGAQANCGQRAFFVQDFTRARLATATARRHAEAIFQVLKIGRTERRRLADFAFGNRVADANVHI